ncbi:hypothetical protein [Teredinibacter turnerae]|uniref:hypothetical protein n=1 Tax=Teredinibacter turnerae TaxID=2426 RepID=UPI0030D05D5D
MRIFIVLIIVLLSGCASIDSVSDKPYFRGVIGSEFEIQRESLLFERSERLYQEEVSHYLYDKDRNNSWREDGWVPVGTKVKILEVNRYSTHEGGPWIGAVGVVFLSANRQVKFIYHWSDFSRHLKKAPWESDDLPKRSVEALL